MTSFLKCRYPLVKQFIFVTPGDPRGIWGRSLTPLCCFLDSRVEAVLVEKDKVLKLTQSQILQTEVRVLYELLYVLNNSYRGNRTFRGVKQVRALD